MSVTIHHGDCAVQVAWLPSDSVDALVTDPPYALGSIVKRFGSENATPPVGNEAYKRMSAGFMGKQWDTGAVAFDVAFWRECLRVLKPGAHVIAFGGTRTYHRLACAIEDAGFEIRDQIGWLYGSGFPKSHNLDGEHEGWGTALKPAWEPIVLARKPLIGTVLENMNAYGVGAINVDGCRVGAEGGGTRCSNRDEEGRCLGHPDRSGTAFGLTYHAAEAEGPLGRWPANVITDGSDEVFAAFPATAPSRKGKPRGAASGEGWGMTQTGAEYDDSGSAARFFYAAKASKADRDDGCQHITRRDEGYEVAPRKNNHPTVKPTELMRYLCRLVTPKGGTVLDPFMGSGSTGRGAVMESFNFIGIEQDAGYVEIARARIAAVTPKIKMPWE